MGYELTVPLYKKYWHLEGFEAKIDLKRMIFKEIGYFRILSIFFFLFLDIQRLV